MGIVNPDTLDNRINFLKKEMNLDVFVEGGTYNGASAIRMSKIFDKVITVEKSPEMFAIAAQHISDVGSDNIVLLKGDTRDFLKNIVVENDNMLFWLDSHWSGGLTYGKEDECPLIQELELIFSTDKNYLVLIDDARLFLSPPPKPHNYLEWPTLRDIFAVIPRDHELVVYDDVIYVVPQSILNQFRKHLQCEITLKWNRNGETGKNSVFSVLLNYVRSKFNQLS